MNTVCSWISIQKLSERTSCICLQLPSIQHGSHLLSRHFLPTRRLLSRAQLMQWPRMPRTSVLMQTESTVLHGSSSGLKATTLRQTTDPSVTYLLIPQQRISSVFWFTPSSAQSRSLHLFQRTTSRLQHIRTATQVSADTATATTCS